MVFYLLYKFIFNNEQKSQLYISQATYRNQSVLYNCKDSDVIT